MINNIVDNLSMDLYNSMLEYAKTNLETSLKYNLTNDHTYDNYFKDVIKNYKK